MADDFETDIAEYEEDCRAKYGADDLKDLQKQGKAMPPSSKGGDPSYPIADQEDLEKAIKAVGRGNADHDAIRLHIIAQADKLGLTKLIPDNWNMTDGSLKQANSAEPEIEAETPVARNRSKKPRHRSGPQAGIEVRHFTAEGLEIRAGKKANTLEITGSPIVYNTPYGVRDMFGEFQETMMPGVAAAILPKADVRFLFNHDGLPLARSASGTMTLDDSDTSLNFTAQLDTRQQLANDLAIAIERGDVSQMSCGFIVAADTWNAAQDERSIYAFKDLLDVSAVTYPASPTTNISVAQRMMNEMPVESRARVRSMWTITRDLKEGRAVDPDALQTLASGLSALAETDDEDEERAAPTATDKKMPKVLSDAHDAVHAALKTQMGDPDNGKDPDDDAVAGHLKNALSSLVKAHLAQGVDGAPVGFPDEGEDGTMNAPVPDPATAQDGTGSRSAEDDEAETRRRRIAIRMQLENERRVA